MASTEESSDTRSSTEATERDPDGSLSTDRSTVPKNQGADDDGGDPKALIPPDGGRFDILMALQPALRHRILLSLDITSLISAAHTCRTWRGVITEQVFLDATCKDRFNLSIDQLPDPLPCQKLLIDTQRLKFQGAEATFVEADPSLVKIYAFYMRAWWMPLAFDDTTVSGDFGPFRIGYPWPYDGRRLRTGEEKAKERENDNAEGTLEKEDGEKKETPKASPKPNRDITRFFYYFHAAFPYVLGQLMNFECRRLWAWGWKSLRFYNDVTKSHLHTLRIDQLCPDLQLSIGTRKPRVLELEPGESSALCILIYDDDQTWRVVVTSLSLGQRRLTAPPRCSPVIGWGATMEEVREAFGELVNQFIVSACGFFMPDDDVVTSGYLFGTQDEYEQFQLETCRMLNEAIIAACDRLQQRLGILPEMEQRKAMKRLQDHHRCLGHHQMPCHNQPPATIGEALNKAIDRAVNARFLPEVKRIYGDVLSYQIMHAWSSVDGAGPERLQARQRIRNACPVRGERRYWPAVVHKKAMDQLPDIIGDLEKALGEYAA